jgi:hypothetical protein
MLAGDPQLSFVFVVMGSVLVKPIAVVENFIWKKMPFYGVSAKFVSYSFPANR